MKFSEHWLREWVNPPVTTKQLADQLTMAGLEVEATEPVAAKLKSIVVGEVIAMEKHPDADKLKVCTVNTGQEKHLQIVCGASNVSVNGKYPVALVGAVLPGDLKIKKAKLRGVPSEGMLCSAKELGMAEQTEGLMTLPTDAPVGTAIDEYLHLDDVSIELSLTPNRGDCLSIAGVAREVAVLNKIDVTPVHSAPVAPVIDDIFPIEIAAKQECPRYVGRVIKNINPQAVTPIWMQERLRRSGLRSISPVVDITNYVLLELGQPMHAFDLDKLNGGIHVRLAKQDEEISLLDGQTLSLDAGTLIIADKNGPVALAGIMGGEGTSVDEKSRHIFLESAFFSPICIAGRARGYGLHTDSSHRFERGVDPALQEYAVERATSLLLDIVGGEPGPVISRHIDEYVPRRNAVLLRHSRLQKVLGVDIQKAVVDDILYRLEQEHVEQKNGWTVTPPSFRFDIEREEDLIEEVARIYGYDNIPIAHSRAPSVMGAQPEARLPLERLQNALVDRGYQEAITYSFVDPKMQELLLAGARPIQLANPISADMAEMRTSLWPGLLNAVAHNLNRQQTCVRLFETGLRFQLSDSELDQEPIIACVVTGSAIPVQWGQKTQEIDYYDIKSDVESILALTGQPEQFIFVAQQHPVLHPGQSAKIVRHIQLNQKHADNMPEDSEEVIGWVGALHPAIATKLDLDQPVFLFELKLAAVTQRAIPHFQEIPKFPSIKRDLAIVVDESVTAQAVSDCIRQGSTTLLTNLKLFDVYRGKGIDSGRKSLAFSLTLQDHERTLTDQDVDAAIDTILSTLNRELGATLRN